jgi:glycosyltransferase involved in cell wall biosynthesis
MAHNHNKIILNLMIKNESKIIERCIGRALEHVDAVSILDTGSTDNTVEICNTFLKASGKPFKVSVEPFKNFGYNRTVSFKKTQDLCTELEWDATKTYAMTVDADMIIKPSPEFKNFEMTVPGYTVIQQNGSLKYHNNRFHQCAYEWKCVGATHEYWSGDPTKKIPYEIFYIDDVNDGGCKSDKFERDIRLLTEDLNEDPKNGRTYFYLAQSYKDSGKFEEAIAHYKKRIEVGGWYEEVWQAHYQIAKCYECLKQPEEMEAWALKAFKFHPYRAEPIFFLVQYFKDRYEHFKAYQYYLKGKDIPFPKNDVLFIEYSIYEGLFEYENTILSCYVFNKSRQDALNDMVSYINTKQHRIDNVWDNIQYYIEPLVSSTYKGEYSKLFFPQVDEFQVSSCSVLPYKNKLLMNTRYVNYSIDSRGQYHMRSADGNVKTRNGMTYLNSSYYPLDDVRMMKEEPDKIYPSNIEGLEDVRLFVHKDKLHFTASSKNITNDGKIVMTIGDYNPENAKMTNINIIQSPKPSDCEKNWIYVPEYSLVSTEAAKNKMNFIYGWDPLQIGAVNMTFDFAKEENKSESEDKPQLEEIKLVQKLEIHTTFETPRFFSRFRGSSTICEYDGRFWCVAHFVKYSTPRVYLHSVVTFNRETMKPESYSLPFVFRKHAIEYCLGFHIKEGKMCFIFSQNDNEPGFITMPITNLRFLPIS